MRARAWGSLGAAIVAVLVVGAALVAAAGPVGATPILDQGDAEELAAALAEAEEEQDICYGWSVTIDDQAAIGRASASRDVGSSRGADVGVEGCARYVVFAAAVVYTSEASEAEDRASFTVTSNVPDAPTVADLRRVGVDEGRLLGEDDDRAVRDATLALPALVAERGIAAPVGLEEQVEPIPATDGPTGGGGSDWLRKNGGLLALAVLILVGGVGWAGWLLVFRRSALTRSH